MKMSKRIFVCLIVLAISVSALAVGAFADASAELKYTVDNHKTILEYYEEPIIFDLDFEDEELVTNGYVNDRLFQLSLVGAALNKASVVEDADGNKYLSIASGAIPPQQATAFLNWNAEEGKNIDDFLLDFSIMASGTGNTVQADLFVVDSPVTNSQITASSPAGTALVKLNFKGSKVTYYDGSESGTTVDVTLTTGSFYNVAINYSVVDGNYDLVITAADGSEVLSVSDLAIPYETIGNIRIGNVAAKMMNTTFCFDNVSASGGSFIRYEADKVPETERAIADFITICESEDVSVESKLEVLKTAFKLVVDHGVVGSDDAAAANVLNIQKIGVGIFVDEISARLALLTDELAYDERVALLEECTSYSELIPEDISYMGDEVEAINAVLTTYEEEFAELDVLKSHSEAILAALADVALTNTNVKSYAYISSYYDAIVDYTPYLGYPGISAIYDDYLTVLEKYAELTDLGNEFIARSLAAADMEIGFGARYAAYVLARDNYFDDTTFPGIDEAFAAYASAEMEMTAAIDICEHFLLNVRRADYSQYLSAKKSALDAASRGAYADGEEAPAIDTQLNLIKDKYIEYPGMTDAIALYDELLLLVTGNEKAAVDYVNAVNALAAVAETLSKEELAAKITEAEEMQKTGNVIGVDGVTEANIILNNLKSQLELSEGYKKQFTTVVGKLEATDVATEIFELAHEAYDVIVNADKYEGVNSADQDKLNAKVSAYNEMVKALNAGFKAANDVACNTVSASSGSPSDDAPVGLIASVIKKFYE